MGEASNKNEKKTLIDHIETQTMLFKNKSANYAKVRQQVSAKLTESSVHSHTPILRYLMMQNLVCSLFIFIP